MWLITQLMLTNSYNKIEISKFYRSKTDYSKMKVRFKPQTTEDEKVRAIKIKVLDEQQPISERTSEEGVG